MLALQEAKASSEIENIVTTQDELFQADLFPEGPQSGAAKEVALYRDAVKLGYEHLLTSQGLITNKTITDMFRLLKGRTDGFRTTPGTALRNEATRDMVYVPTQDRYESADHMSALEQFINNDDTCDLDPLVKMAIIHHQFKSIHPFPDGNGRVGRILNVLYLTRSGLLDIPILYLSRYITRNKAAYYKRLQDVRDRGDWAAWVLYMLQGVTETSQTTFTLVEAIRGQMAASKHRMRHEIPKIYSQDLLNNLFRHPYTRIDFLVNDLKVTRQTASKHLEALAEHGFVEKHQAGRSNYYINVPLVALFMDDNA